VTGQSSATWNGPSGQVPDDPVVGGSSIPLLVLTSDGTYRWHNFYGSGVYGQEIAAPNGGVYIAGTSNSTWNGPAGQSPVNAYAGGGDAFLLKVTPESPSLILSDEGAGFVSEMAAAGYGSYHLYEALVALTQNTDPTLDPNWMDLFLIRFGTCPGSSAVFTTRLTPGTTVAMSDDCTVASTSILGSAFYGQSGDTTVTTTESGVGKLDFTYATSLTPLTSWQANSTVYNAFAIAWAPPEVTTEPVNIIGTTFATGGGDVTTDGGIPVTARGVCWNSAANPTTANTCTSNGAGTGMFTSSITGLQPGSQYHVRAYATSAAGTAYGADVQFSTVAALAPPAIGKAFGASSILLNGSTSLSFKLANPNQTVALTGVGFSDSFPAGLQVAATPKVSNGCGGTFKATANSATASLSGGSIAGNSSCTISLTVTGTAVGIKNNTTGAVSSTNGGTGTTSNMATLSVNLPPSIISPSNVTFTPGATSSFTVKTTGFPVPAISESGALPAGVTFADNGNGTATLGGIATTGGTFRLTITANNGVSPNAVQSFTLNAIGPYATLSPSTLAFGTVYLGSVTIKTLTVTNTGNQPMTIADPLISIVQGGDSKEFVALNLCPNSLAAGKSCTIVITFFAGPFFNPQTATLSIVDNVPGSPQSINLTALVIYPEAKLSTTGLNFGTEKVNSSNAAQTVTLTNPGATPLTINSITIAGTNTSDFKETNNCPSSLAVNAGCTINVTFTPTAKGPRSASVVFADNAINSPQGISLAGMGN
jgi:hypothetical protein